MATKSINFKSQDNKSLSVSELKKRGAAAAALAAAIIGGSVAVGGCSDAQETAEAAEEPAADALAEDLAAEVAANEAAQQPQAQSAPQAEAHPEATAQAAPQPQAQAEPAAGAAQPQHFAQHSAEAEEADIPVDTDFLNRYGNMGRNEHTDGPAPEHPAEQTEPAPAEPIAQEQPAEPTPDEPIAQEQPAEPPLDEPIAQEQPAVAELQGIPAAPMTIFENAKYTPVEINQVDFNGTPVTMAITTDPNGDTYYLADMDGNGTFETVFDANLSPVAQLNIPGSDDLLAVSKVQEIIDYNSGLLNGQDKEFMAEHVEADEQPADEPLVAQNDIDHPADAHPADQDDDVIEIDDDTITDEVLVENVSGDHGSVVSFLHNLVFSSDDDVAQSDVMIEENEEFIDEPDDADDVTDEPIVDEPVE